MDGNSFIFLSPHRSIIASGCYTTIETSARDGDDLEGRFQQDLSTAFASAASAGIVIPIVVGAIPFDTSRPSALFIPQHVHFLENSGRRQGPCTNADSGRLMTTGMQEVPNRKYFEEMVAQGACITGSGTGVDKVVLSRLVDITTTHPLSSIALFERLGSQNPAAFNFHVPIPGGGNLIGASPELLLRLEGDTFTSNPLAGSASRVHNHKEADRAVGNALLRSPKDRYEHDLVTAAIHNFLSPRSATLTVPPEPELLTTPTLWHLSTPIEGKAKDKKENALSLACLLHPTPALSGSPDRAAQRLIRELEPFDRGLFGGIVGWCDAEGNGEWVVTIRSAQVEGNRVRLFAGAGIVPASEPAAEWSETETKLLTMLNALGLGGNVFDIESGQGRASL